MISRSSGPGPVGMAAGAPLVDPLREVAHLGDAVGDLLPEQHSAAARLRPLAHHDLDGVRAPQVVGVHPVTRGQQLVDERLRGLALLGRHAAVAGGGRGAGDGGASPERLLRRPRQRAEAHPGDGDRDVEMYRLLRETRANRYIRVAALAVALERVARHARAEEEQVVEVRHGPLGAEAADVVDALAGRALDLVDDVAIEDRALAEARPPAAADGAPLDLVTRLAERVELGQGGQTP